MFAPPIKKPKAKTAALTVPARAAKPPHVPWGCLKRARSSTDAVRSRLQRGPVERPSRGDGSGETPLAIRATPSSVEADELAEQVMQWSFPAIGYRSPRAILFRRALAGELGPGSSRRSRLRWGGQFRDKR